MFGRTSQSLRPLASKLMTSTRGMSSKPGFGAVPQALYQGVWRKSNIAYITYIVVGCVAIEIVYGSVTQSIWDSANQGVSDVIDDEFLYI